MRASDWIVLIFLDEVLQMCMYYYNTMSLYKYIVQELRFGTSKLDPEQRVERANKRCMYYRAVGQARHTAIDVGEKKLLLSFKLQNQIIFIHHSHLAASP